jgi:two-component system sensor histidine kinase RegB
MVMDVTSGPLTEQPSLRLQTLIKLRWLAVGGQLAAVFAVSLVMEFPLPVSLCLILIACSAWLNVFLSLRYRTSLLLRENAAFALLAYDILQLGVLLYLTGGLQNPFSILLIVPVVVSATSRSVTRTAILGLLAVGIATLIMFFHQPLPWHPGESLKLPLFYVAGTWFAIVSSLAFTAIYAFRVSEEAHKLADALAATELVLQREHHLSALDGLAAAAAHELGTPLATIALVSREMSRELADDNPLKEDADLLRSQAERCRQILQKLTSLSTESDDHLARLPLRALIDDVVRPHRDFGVAITVNYSGEPSREPVGRRNPGILYGLGNIIENAVDFARGEVTVSAEWTERVVSIRVADDGRGFPPELIRRIGEPFISTRDRSGEAGQDGLGLGLFIAKTLLERSGATLEFANLRQAGQSEGAVITIAWPRSAMEHGEA